MRELALHQLAQGLVVCLLALAPSALALYSKSDAVVELTAANFDKLVHQAEGVAAVEFYAPWCGHCKSLAPSYKKIADKLQGMALVGAVDCDNKANGPVCQKYGIRGFPTIKLFGSDRVKNPYTGEKAKEAIDYNGPRMAKPLMDAVTSLLTDLHIKRLGSEEEMEGWQAAAREAGKPQVLLFTTKDGGSTPLYRALSTALHAVMDFGEVHAPSAPALAEAFGVTEFPTLLVSKVDGGASGSDVYDGDLKAPALLAWLRRYGGGPAAEGEEVDGGAEGSGGDASGGKGGKKGAETWAFVRQVDTLAELPELEAREDMALLALHAVPEGEAQAGACAAERAAFLTAAGEMQAVVDTLLVSVTPAEAEARAADLARLGVDGEALAAAPCSLQLVLLPFGADKAQLEDYSVYTGALEGKALQAWVTGAMPALAAEMDDASAPALLTADPSDGRMVLAPKAVLFTNKDEAPGVFKALALALRGRGNMVFTWVKVGGPAAQGLVDNFKPPRVPFLSVILRQPVPPTEAGGDGAHAGVRFATSPYFGPLKFTPMLAFLKDMADQVEQASGMVLDPEVAKAALPQITTQAEMEEHCTSKAGLCLLGLLDGSAHEEQLQRQQQELMAVALKRAAAGQAASAFAFAWIDGRAHTGVARALGVRASDLPALVALSPRRMRLAVMPPPPEGSRLGRAAVEAFLEGLLSGKVRTEALQALPEVKEGGDGAAGEEAAAASSGAGGAAPDAAAADAAAAAEEADEFDLGDIMAEEVEGGVAGAAGKADRLAEIDEQLKAEEEARQAAAKEAAAKAGKKKKKSKKGKKKKAKASEEL